MTTEAAPAELPEGWAVAERYADGSPMDWARPGVALRVRRNNGRYWIIDACNGVRARGPAGGVRQFRSAGAAAIEADMMAAAGASPAAGDPWTDMPFPVTAESGPQAAPFFAGEVRVTLDPAGAFIARHPDLGKSGRMLSPGLAIRSLLHARGYRGVRIAPSAPMLAAPALFEITRTHAGDDREFGYFRTRDQADAWAREVRVPYFEIWRGAFVEGEFHAERRVMICEPDEEREAPEDTPSLPAPWWITER